MRGEDGQHQPGSSTSAWSPTRSSKDLLHTRQPSSTQTKHTVPPCQAIFGNWKTNRSRIQPIGQFLGWPLPTVGKWGCVNCASLKRHLSPQPTPEKLSTNAMKSFQNADTETRRFWKIGDLFIISSTISFIQSICNLYMYNLLMSAKAWNTVSKFQINFKCNSSCFLWRCTLYIHIFCRASKLAEL